MKRVFISGLDSDKVYDIILNLKMGYINPLNESAIDSIRYKLICDYVLYIITPKNIDLFRIAEVVDGSNKIPNKTLLCVLYDEGYLSFDDNTIKSIELVKHLVSQNGSKVFSSVDSAVNYLNKNI